LIDPSIGDNRQLDLIDAVDRISLGLIPTSEFGWPIALRALKPRGGMLHVHNNIKVLFWWSVVVELVFAFCVG
jgi:tRNA wybutosine-synthesizing protein 2